MLIDAAKGMGIMPRERSQTHESRIFIVRLHSGEISRMDKSIDRLAVAMGCGEERMGGKTKELCFEVMEMFWN